MQLSFWWSRSFLTNRAFLWLLFISNLLGTIYGYIWYESQIRETIEHHPLWQVIFVPDSPTASLFFTISLLFLLFSNALSKYRVLRSLIEALAVVTSVKYGIWAVSMIFAGAYQGNVLVWQDWMLVSSHLAMAIEALIYVRFFRFRKVTLLIAGLWTLLNDTVDYTYGVYPYLPSVLKDNVTMIQNFTISLTLFSVVVAWLALRQAKRG